MLLQLWRGAFSYSVISPRYCVQFIVLYHLNAV